MRVSTVVLLSVLSSNAVADIYTCEINQRTVYSDTPCSDINKNIKTAIIEKTNWWEGHLGRNQYKRPILLNGALDVRVDKVASIINDAWEKSNNCQTAMNTGNEGTACKDFTQFIEPGTIFWQASHQYQALNLYTKNKIKDQNKLQTIKNQIGELVDFRAQLKNYVREQQLAQR